MKDKLIRLILEAPQTPCIIGGSASGKTFKTAETSPITFSPQE